MSDPARANFTTFRAGRRVKVVTGSSYSQTVNVCTVENRNGVYDAIYRLPLEKAVQEVDLPKLDDLRALYEWLVNERCATLEIRTATGSAPRLVEAIPSPDISDPWVVRAVAATEAAIDELVDEFQEHPYLHRVESSLHVRLFELLAQQTAFADSRLSRLGILIKRRNYFTRSGPKPCLMNTLGADCSTAR